MNFKYLPYDFIPVDSVDDTHSYEDKGELTGKLHVELEVKTPFVAIREDSNKTVMPTGRTIPGSSLKGMLRNAAEIIWNDYISVLDKDLTKDPRVPEQWRNENVTIDKHGPVSHLFGFAVAKRGEKDTRETDSKHNNSTLGSRLFFSNAVLKGNLKAAKCVWRKHTLSTPQGLSVGFYKEKGISAGRKVYLAGATGDLTRKLNAIGNASLDPKSRDYIGTRGAAQGNSSSDLLVLPGTCYSFTIKFQQLTEQELADVIRLLELMPERYHALGRGKPLGLGRVKLSVGTIQVYDKNSFFTLTSKELAGTISKGEILQKTQHTYQQSMEQYCELLDEKRFHKQKAYNQPGSPAKPYRQLKNTQQPAPSTKDSVSFENKREVEKPAAPSGKWESAKPAAPSGKHEGEKPAVPSRKREERGSAPKKNSGGGFANNPFAAAFQRAEENKSKNKGKKS